MNFDHPWALLLALAPLVWLAFEWRTSARRPALLLKAGTFFCILLALSAPSMTIYQTKVAVAFLADTSASVTPQDLKAELLRTDEEFHNLAARHHELEDRLQELTAKHYLSEPEQLEEVTLKKRKLQLKDRMEDILRRHRQTPAQAHS